MKKINIIQLSIITIILLILIVLGTNLPLGIPSDWEWLRVRGYSIPIIGLVSLLFLTFLGLLLSYIIDKKIINEKKQWKFLGIVVLSACGVFFDYQVQLVGRFSITENYLAVGDQWSSGYLHQASRIKNINIFLKKYQENLSVKDANLVTHIDVHPPGNTLYAYAFLHFVNNNPKWVEKLIQLCESPKIHADCEVVFAEGNISKRYNLQKYLNASILITFSFFILLFLSRILLALSLLLLYQNCKNIGLFLFFLWSIGGPLLFFGHFDIINYFLSSLCVFLLILWINKQRLFYLFLLGLTVGCSVLFSVGFGILILFFSIFIISWSLLKKQKFIINSSGFILGGITLIVLCLFWEVNIVGIVFKCLSNNVVFDKMTERSPWWLVVNYLDYLLFVGPLCLYTLIYFLKKTVFNFSLIKYFHYLAASIYSIILIAAFYFLKGETGRLILLFMPINILLVGYQMQSLPKLKKQYYIIIILSIIMVIALRISIKTVFIAPISL